MFATNVASTTTRVEQNPLHVSFVSLFESNNYGLVCTLKDGAVYPVEHGPN